MRIHLFVLAACLAACNDPAPPVEGAKTVLPDGTVAALAAEDRDLAREAVDVLAAELGVAADAITVDTVRAVEWRDSSLGCPQPGESYLQVITPGHRVTLRHDGRFYYVHAAQGRAFVCRAAKSPAAGAQTIELEWGPMAMAARDDLASRLGVEPGDIIVGAAEGTSWTDSSLGCPEPDAEYEAERVDGYVLVLRHGSRNYTYHTDLERVVPCPPITED